MEKSTVQAAIRAAFDDVPYPGDDNIGSADGPREAEVVTEWLRGVDWRSLKANELWDSAPYYMTPQAYHYYFPAFLLGIMEDDCANNLYDVVHYKITPPPSVEDYMRGFEAQHPEQWQGDFRSWKINDFQDKHSRFTTAQRRAVRDYLTWDLEMQPELARENIEWIRGNPRIGQIDPQAFAEHQQRDIEELRALRDYWEQFSREP